MFCFRIVNEMKWSDDIVHEMVSIDMNMYKAFRALELVFKSIVQWRKLTILWSFIQKANGQRCFPFILSANKVNSKLCSVNLKFNMKFLFVCMQCTMRFTNALSRVNSEYVEDFSYLPWAMCNVCPKWKNNEDQLTKFEEEKCIDSTYEVSAYDINVQTTTK